MKGKYYRVLQDKYTQTRQFIFILDWDEILSEDLIKEIQTLDLQKDVYYINRHTYFIQKPIDKNSYLPLLFQIDAVEIAPFDIFHKL